MSDNDHAASDRGAGDDRVVRLRNGVLELVICSLLHRAPSYGGEIIEMLSGDEVLAAGAGTVYPLLSRLRGQGLVETSWQESPLGPPRKYYRLTGSGERFLGRGVHAWRELVAAMGDYVKDVSQ